MLTATEIAGFAGAGLAGAAYVPQVSHLIRARCSAGISRLAFGVWLLASVLTTARAIAIGAGVFIVLGGIEIVATTVIMLCAIRYKDTPCPSHLPRPPEAKKATRTGSSGNGPGSRRPFGRPVAESATPAGHGGGRRGYVPVLQPNSCAATAQAGGSRPGTELQTTHLKGDDMTASAGAATDASEEPGAVPGETAGAQAAIVIVSRDPGAREILHRELSKRYGADYQILACGRPAELAAWMRGLRAAGRPVALVIGGVGARDLDGIEVLAGLRAIDPAALRVAAVGWGDWEAVRSVFDAVTLGTVDHWVTSPVQAPAEEFHRSITEFLRDWSSQRGGGFEPVRVIGKRWSARSQELRDLFARHRIPVGFYDAASARARQMLHEAGLRGPADRGCRG